MKTELTRDSLFSEELICYQPLTGYRFSVDSVLLAHFTEIKNEAKILDLGCGCGVISLILSYRHQERGVSIDSLELQRSLFEIAERNISKNDLSNIISLKEGDINNVRELYAAESFSNVFCNPPFYKVSNGKKNIDEQSFIARHQVKIDIESVVKGCSYCVKNRGLVTIIYPANGVSELMSLLSQNRLTPKRMQIIYGYPQSNNPAKLVIIESIKNGGEGLSILPPFYIYQRKDGDYSPQMDMMFLPNSDLLPSCSQK